MPTGQSSTFTFGTSGITLDVISITPPTEEINDIPQPHLGLTVGDIMPYEPGDLVEGGEYTIVFANDMDTSIALRVDETMTWTKPLQSGDTTAANWVFKGYIKSSTEDQYITNERATITTVVKVSNSDGNNVTKNGAT